MIPSSAPQARTTRHQGLSKVIGVSKIQNGITEYNHQLLMLSSELASQRIFSGPGHYSFSDPLPELSLGGPELPAITADDQGSFLLFLFLILLFGAHGSLETGRAIWPA